MTEPAALRRPAGIVGIAATIGTALLPKLTCPVCWPAYTAALGALGFSFVDYTPYLMPLTAFFVAVTLAVLAWTARARRSAAPLIAGVLGGAGLLTGKFVLENDLVTYAAIGLFVIASFLPLPFHTQAACSACVSTPAKETV